MWDIALQIAMKLFHAGQEVNGLSPGETTELPEIVTHYNHGKYRLTVTVERL